MSYDDRFEARNQREARVAELYWKCDPHGATNSLAFEIWTELRGFHRILSEIDERIAGLERASFNSGYCYGLEGDASPEELDCAWDLHCRDRRASLLASAPASEPDAGEVERGSLTWWIDQADTHAEDRGESGILIDRDHWSNILRNRAAITALTPRIDAAKLAEIRSSAFKHMADAMGEIAHGSRDIAIRDLNAAEREVRTLLAMIGGQRDE